MEEKTATGEKRGIDEKFLKEQKIKIEALIVKKEEYANLFKDEKDIESRQAVENVKAEIVELNKAIERIDHGTYGLCKTYRNQIPKKRLIAMPLATSCTKCTKCGANKN